MKLEEETVTLRQLFLLNIRMDEGEIEMCTRGKNSKWKSEIKTKIYFSQSSHLRLTHLILRGNSLTGY